MDISILPYRFEQFDPHTPFEIEWGYYHRFRRRYYEETPSREPMRSDVRVEKEMKSSSNETQLDYFSLVYDHSIDKETVGFGHVMQYLPPSPFYKTKRRNMIRVVFELLPEHRRKGLGKYMLGILDKILDRSSHNTLFWIARKEDGLAVSRHIGAREVLGQFNAEAAISHVDKVSINALINKRKQTYPYISIQVSSSIPDTLLDEFATSYTAILNRVPGMTEPVNLSAEKIGNRATKDKEIGKTRYTALAIDTNHGASQIIGVSELWVDGDNPTVGHQELTGVLKEFEGMGLAKWLKAEMLFYHMEQGILDTIFTESAPENESMRAINKSLGFVETGYFAVFEMDHQLLKAYLKS